jgi:hypothetical protein
MVMQQCVTQHRSNNMEAIMIGLIVFICAAIGTACALAPFFAHINNKINKKYDLEDKNDS